MQLANVLSSSGYFIVNKALCKKVGLLSAAVLGEMYSKYVYLKKNDKLTEDGYFYYTREDLEDSMGLSPYEQRKAINVLAKYGVMDSKLIGLPATMYYKIDENKLAEILELTIDTLSIKTEENLEKSTSDKMLKIENPRCQNFSHLDTKNFEPNNNIYNNTDLSINTTRNNIPRSINGTAKNAAPKTLTTKKSKKTKNDYGDMFFRISDEFGFSEAVTLALEKFGNVLVTAKAHCTPEGVRGQLTALSDNVKNDKDRIEIINRAIACGHTTLIYSIENYTRTKGFNKAGRPSWESDKLKSTYEEERREMQEAVERGEVKWY